MNDYFLSFLLDFFILFHIFRKWKIIFINFRWSFFGLNFRHLVNIFDLSFFRLFFSLRLITYNTSLRSRGHKRTIRIYLLLNLYLLNNYLLLDDVFFRNKVFFCVFILNRQYFSSNKRVSKLLFFDFL